MKRKVQRSTARATRLRFESLESRRLLAAVTAPTDSTPVISLRLSGEPTIVEAPALAGGNLVNASAAGQAQILDIGQNQVFAFSVANGRNNFDVSDFFALNELQIAGDFFDLSPTNDAQRLNSILLEELQIANRTRAIASTTPAENHVSEFFTARRINAYFGVAPSRTLPASGLRPIRETINVIASRPLQPSISVQNLSGAPLSTAPTLDIAVNESQTLSTPLAVTDLPQSSDLVDLSSKAARELQASGNQINSVSMSSFRVEPVMARHHRIELNQVATEVRAAEIAPKSATDPNAKTAVNTARSATVSTASHRESSDGRMAASPTTARVRFTPHDHRSKGNIRVLYTSHANNDQGAVNSDGGGDVTEPQTVDRADTVVTPILITEESAISIQPGTPLSSDQPREDWERAVEVVMAVTVGAVVWTQQQRKNEDESHHSLCRS